MQQKQQLYTHKKQKIPFLASLSFPYWAVMGATAKRFLSRSCTRSLTRLYSSRTLQALDSLSLKQTALLQMHKIV